MTNQNNNNAVRKRTALHDSLKKQRNFLNSGFQEISDLVLTTGQQFFIDRRFPSLPQGINVFNTTARRANKNLASTIYSNLCARNSNWFTLESNNEKLKNDSTIKNYLQYCTKQILQHLNNPTYKFPVANKEALPQASGLGTSCIRMIELASGDLMYQSVSLNQLYIMEDSFENISTVINEFEYTLDQALQQWPAESLHESMITKGEKDPTTLFKFRHTVKPLNTDEKNNSAFNFYSCYDDISHQQLVSEGYLYYNPYVVFRFDKEVGSVYGSSPGWLVLPDIRMSNVMSREKITIIQLHSKPPILTMNDGVLPPFKLEPNLFLPGGLDQATGDFRVKTMPIGGDLNPLMLSITDIEKNIEEAFFSNPFMGREGPALTATEVVQIRDESLRNIAPYIARIEVECYNKIVLQTFESMLRNQKLPPIPEGLSFNDLKIEYTSPLAKMAKMEDGNSILRFQSIIGPLFQVYPELRDLLNSQRLGELGVEASGLPNIVLNTPEEIANIQQERSKQQSLQNNMALMQEMTKLKAGNVQGPQGQ